MDKLAPEPQAPTFQPQKDWPVLVVDDDSETLTISRIALSDYHFRGRGLEILEARSVLEALAIMTERRDIAVILLDVVMETEQAGLALIETIRNQLGNHQIRIVLRTGETHFNLRQLIHQFDINDFHHKTEITAERLEIIITAALRG
ncbi:MAG: response regulator, partial [Alphaproteobacteria bacterium]|nr:response regulator [Alphaproteobacteria bacterium]